jgi:aryl-alcohol dehydrogenase-like predicted oxidoreductase
MEHRKTGNGGLELPVVTFGAWAIGGLFWAGTDDALAVEAIHAAIDSGMDAIDTAPIYGCGHSEMIVGRAIKGRRERVMILTKLGLRWDSTEGEFHFTFPKPGGGEVVAYKNVTANSIVYECEQSLRRLDTDVIDLYQVHWPSTSASAEETMAALSRLLSQGKIRAIGVSNYSTAQLVEALRFAPVASNQIKYNLLQREIETDPLPLCRERNVGVICYSPMCLGLLTGRVGMDRAFDETDVRCKHPWYQHAARRRVLAALELLRPIAEAHGATLGQLSVAWLLAQPGITTALVGARNAEQVRENARAADIRLSPDEVGGIREVFERLGNPEGGS